MGLEEYTNKKGDETTAKAEENSEGFSVPDIQQDEKKANLFGEMLKQKGESDLSEKLLARGAIPMSMEDLRTLEPQRKAFAEQWHNIEEVEENLTPEMMQKIAAKQEDFAIIFNYGGGGKTKELLSHAIELMAVRDPGHFNDIQITVRGIAEAEKKEEEKFNALKELAQSYKIPEEKFKSIIREENYRKREKLAEDAVREMYEGGLGEWSFWNYLKGTRKGEWLKEREEQVRILVEGSAKEIINLALEAKAHRAEVDKMLVVTENAKKEAGGALAAAFTGNTELNTALVRFLGGEEPEKEEFVAFTEIRDQVPTKAQVEQAFTQYKIDHKDFAFDGSHDADWHSDELAKSLAGPLRSRFKDKKGPWAEVLQNGSFLKNIVKGYKLF